MGLFSLEHSRAAYRADFVLYGALVAVLSALLWLGGPRAQWLQLVGITLAGLASWSAIEYAAHRFVLHGLPPFSRWHAEHHRRPTALLGTPTLLSVLLIATFVFLPALVVGGLWRACALTLGLSLGYLAYATTHHASHHVPGGNAWLKRRKRWHARHHHVAQTACFGVTTALWDHVFGTTGRPGVRTGGITTPRKRAHAPPVDPSPQCAALGTLRGATVSAHSLRNF